MKKLRKAKPHRKYQVAIIVLWAAWMLAIHYLTN